MSNSVKETPLPARPVQARGRATRDRILSAALDEFALHGVAASTLEAIRTRAGVGWGTLHHWFPRREDLYPAFLADRLAVAAARADAWLAAPEGSARPVISGCYRDLLLPGGPSELYGLAVREGLEHPERLLAMLEPGQRPLYEIILPVVEHAQSVGELRTDVPAGVLTRTLNSASLAPVGGAAVPPEVAIGVVLGVIWDGAGARP